MRFLPILPLLCLACRSPGPETKPPSRSSPAKPSAASRDPEASLRAARAVDGAGAPWSEAWTLGVWAASPGEPGPSALARGLGVEARPWSGGRPATRPGEAAILWVDAGSPIPALAEALRPSPGPSSRGDLVVVLAPSEGPEGESWRHEAAATLPFSRAALVDPWASLSLYVEPSRALREPDLAPAMAALLLSEHYGTRHLPLERELPPGLDEILRPPSLEDAHAPDIRRVAEAARAGLGAGLEADPQVAVRLGVAASSEAQDVLLSLSRDPEPLVRARSLERLLDVSRLDALLDDPSSVVRVVAADRLGALARQGVTDPRLADALRKAARSPDAYMRWKAAASLGHLPGNVAILAELLGDADSDVQREAARSLRWTRDPSAIAPLVSALALPNSFVRLWAVESLAFFDGPEVRAALTRALEDPSVRVASTAASALARWGHRAPTRAFIPPGPPRGPEEIHALATHADPTMRKDLCKFLAGRADASTTLLALSRDADGEVRKSAVEAMAITPGADEELAVFLQDPEPDVIVTALDAFRRGGKGPVEAIAPFLDHRDAEIRLRAVEALAALGAVEALRARAKDPDERIRAAVAALLPELIRPEDPSVLVRRAAATHAREPARWEQDFDLLVRAASPSWASGDAAFWARGVIAREDELVHLRFSWNDPKDRPAAYRSLRPPTIRAYGHPDRG